MLHGMIQHLTLAKTSQYSPTEVMVRLGLVLVLMIVLVWLAMLVRKKLMKQDEGPPVGFTLKDLRDMHAAGTISDEELAKAEAKTLSQSRQAYLGDNQASDVQAESTAQEAKAQDLGDISDGFEDGGPEGEGRASDKID